MSRSVSEAIVAVVPRKRQCHCVECVAGAAIIERLGYSVRSFRAGPGFAVWGWLWAAEDLASVAPDALSSSLLGTRR